MSLANTIANVLGMQVIYIFKNLSFWTFWFTGVYFIQDFSSINQDLTLTNLGLDSLMVMEVQQTLERMRGIKVQTPEVPLLTIAQIESFEKK